MNEDKNSCNSTDAPSYSTRMFIFKVLRKLKIIAQTIYKIVIVPFAGGVLGALIKFIEMFDINRFTDKYRKNRQQKSFRELLDELKKEMKMDEFSFWVSQVFMWSGFIIIMVITIPFLLLISILKGVLEGLSLQQILRSKIGQIDEMSGYEFEIFLKNLFAENGYRVETTRRTGDQGADLIVSIDGIKTIVQAKRYKGKISNRAIQEATTAIKYYKCDNAMVVTNSVFTKSAIDLADSNSIELVDKNKLKNLVYKALHN